MRTTFQELTVSTHRMVEALDITEDLNHLLTHSGIQEGILVVSSLHTTCALTVNENEERLLQDLEAHFLTLFPPGRPWKHNDLHLRQGIPPDEPKNAHAHLIAMTLGNGETLVVHEGRIRLGRYQAVLLVELDGPRQRRLAVQLMGVPLEQR